MNFHFNFIFENNIRNYFSEYWRFNSSLTGISLKYSQGRSSVLQVTGMIEGFSWV